VADPIDEGRWEQFPHGADIGVRGIASTIEGAFEQAALALTAVVTDPASLQSSEDVQISCEAPDEELLLVDWLNAVIYEMATRGMLFGRFEVEIDQCRLSGRAWGQPFDPESQELTVEPKGATYTALSVRQFDDGSWEAACVVDV
jgi:tRNA nucleotidyltransferase (CCA-adding enzyme)